ncbi:MAG TPA: hypothetical protein VKB05_01255 [Pyrinomonadaceae bacterium]|nr:hypothetical protein [Pyrinomonadaceae bacterium]
MTNLPFDEKKATELIRQCRHLNVFPGFLNKYYPGEPSNPVSKLLQELLDEAVDLLGIMSEAEIRSLVESLPTGIRAFVDLRVKDDLDDLKLRRIAFQCLVAFVQKGYFPFKTPVDADLNRSEVLKVYPELRELLDDDGLLRLDDRFTLHDAGIEYKDHVLHYHQFLRRGFTSNPNFNFLNLFIDYYVRTASTNTFRVAIDQSRLMPKEFLQHLFEFDTWYGPRFDRSKLDDLNEVGLTVLKRTPTLVAKIFFDNVERTEFFWSYRDGIKTFEVEGVSEESALFDAYYLNKYVHSERDVRASVLRHCDGAVKVYLKDEYNQRLNTYMPREPRSFKRIKVFRIDGNIDVDKWIELLSQFFKGNEMIIEYFDPELFQQKFPDQASKTEPPAEILEGQ